MIRVAPTASLSRAPRVRVLVDEAHSNAWSARRDVAARMQPSHPGDSSYAIAAELLADRDFEVVIHAEGPLDAAALAGAHVVVIAHPSDPAWEATTGVGSPRYSGDELAALHEFVRGGGGLMVLGETEEAKYGANLDELVAPFGIGFANVTVQDYERHHRAPSWVLCDVPATTVTHGVSQACVYRAGALTIDGDAEIVLRSSATAAPADAVLAAGVTYGDGRVMVFADSDLFGDDCIGEFDHARLWVNSVYWVALPSFAAHDAQSASPVLADPRWTDLVDAVESLRDMQNADGSITAAEHDMTEVAALVERIAGDIDALASHVPHDAEFLSLVVGDLRAWVTAGCVKPDFLASLEAFRPEQMRADGLEHLVVFPMYTPNGSGDTRFEALVVRGPWPGWLDVIERTRYDNDKFVPVMLLGHTSGYASECAVFFPETVSVSGSAPNYFGGIFADREAARFQQVTGAAVDAVRLSLPPDAQALFADLSLATDTFLLWDLIHDQTHSRGDLPFDPFMVRQRMPFWMYSLEELRCDLTSIVEAGRLAAEFPFARHVQYAALLDRMLRFPITGSRVRNYDGLGGQVLFGYLHSNGIARWVDNTLVIDWEALPAAIESLLEEIRALYRTGIDSSRVRYWIAGHDFVSRYVAPALASRWTPDARQVDAPSEDEPRAWVDRVLDDEFPLNLFFRSLHAKMAPVFEARSRELRATAARVAA